MTDRIELLRRLSEAIGPPGAEDDVRAIVRRELESCGTISYDRLGSVLCEREGEASDPRVLLDAHLDEVGFLVQSIRPGGMLAIQPLGGWWTHVLPAQRVDVVTEAGDRVPAIVGSKPPHHLRADERDRVLPVEELYLDVGATSVEEVTALGIAVGDAVAPHAPCVDLAVSGTLSGKAFDDRIGVTVLCAAMARLSRGAHPNTVVAVGAVQEEVGTRGAGTACVAARPDVAIVLEATPADDTPGSPAPPQAKLGAGPQLRMFDPTMIADRRLVRWVRERADAAGVGLQLAVRRSGGTDAAAIHRHGRGVPTVVVGVPTRYIHTHAAIARVADVDATIDLVVDLVTGLDREVVAGLASFGGG